MSIFKGSCVALITPFKDGAINFDALGKLIDFQITNKTDAILVNGTTGEPSTMTTEEKLSVIEYAVKKIDGRVPVIAGAGSNCTRTAIELTGAAERLGVDALLHVTPYYNKCSQTGLVKHYSEISKNTSLPIIAYNVPSRTGVNILPDTVKRIADECENVVAIKEASGNLNQISEIAKLVSGRLDIYSGNDDQIVPVLELGGKGIISVAANIVPMQIHYITEVYFGGDVDGANALQERLNPLISALFSDVSPIPAKTALNLMGMEAGELRLPLCEMEASAAKKLHDIMRKYGLIK